MSIEHDKEDRIEKDMEMPIGPITRALAKKIRNAFSTLVTGLMREDKHGSKFEDVKLPGPISLCKVGTN